jgi:VWFA-related protein
MSTKDAPALFKARVSLVLVPVVVRDAKGHAIGTFTKDNFQLFDKGKLQEITKFSVEKAGSKVFKEAQTMDTVPGAGDGVPTPDIPERFIAYLFDDVHVKTGDLIRARDAAWRQLATMPKTDRAAIYSTSGQDPLDFTDDKEKLHATLLRLRSRPIGEASMAGVCPEIGFYMSDQIVNKYDPQAINLGVLEYRACNNSTATGPATPQETAMINGMAMRVLHAGEQESRISLAVLKDVIRRMASMPGQRIVVLASPGFLTPDMQDDKSDILDRAVRASVTISSVDARGLWVDPTLDASQPNRSNTTAYMMLKQSYDRASASAEGDVLAELAYGTGGTFFQNNNDLDAGFRQSAIPPEFYYVLGFAPQNLKLDGSFHGLKVAIKTTPNESLALQARKGYYAPRKPTDAQEATREEIEEALFSREELGELPVELHTQFFKASEKDATITVVCRVDPKRIPFHKADGRNNDVLTIVSGIFDRNGNFLSGMQKTVDMKLKDATLAKLNASGTLSLKQNFSVEPGTYMVRLVVRDSEGQLISALSSAVAIQ